MRAFSRSRLEAICSERGRPELFGIILARRERVQLAVNCLFALSLVAAAAVCVIWWWPVSGDGRGWSRVGMIVAAVSALLTASVILPWAVGRVWGERFLVGSWESSAWWQWSWHRCL
ncbi:MAG: hypothetical protein Ct9H300mP1_14940 [Planctomycetaceae bacterium]|nr:MAG: hypothetical protein Ct9H300mP1_14940 [Planctomycetaceae bacterium]